MRYLVIENKIVSYEYFMDHMKDWEISLLLPIAMDAQKTEWQTARYVAYHNARISGNMKKQYLEKPITELFPLPYDKDLKKYEDHNIEITANQIADLKNRSQRVKEKLFRKK